MIFPANETSIDKGFVGFPSRFCRFNWKRCLAYKGINKAIFETTRDGLKAGYMPLGFGEFSLLTIDPNFIAWRNFTLISMLAFRSQISLYKSLESSLNKSFRPLSINGFSDWVEASCLAFSQQFPSVAMIHRQHWCLVAPFPETSTGFPGARGMRQGIENGQTHVLGDRSAQR